MLACGKLVMPIENNCNQNVIRAGVVELMLIKELNKLQIDYISPQSVPDKIWRQICCQNSV